MAHVPLDMKEVHPVPPVLHWTVGRWITAMICWLDRPVLLISGDGCVAYGEGLVNRWLRQELSESCPSRNQVDHGRGLERRSRLGCRGAQGAFLRSRHLGVRLGSTDLPFSAVAGRLRGLLRNRPHSEQAGKASQVGTRRASARALPSMHPHRFTVTLADVPIIRRPLPLTLILEHSWSTRPSCLPGAEHLCTQGRRKFSS